MTQAAPIEIIGVLHLLPLPASPSVSPGFPAVLARALQDAERLWGAGVRSLIVENLGDAPFRAERVDPHVPAMLAVVGSHLRQRYGDELRLGINVLRNDGQAALGVAAAVGADFVRINVWTGATWTDQGLITGQAHDLLRYRRELGLTAHELAVAADVLVKHGVPAGSEDVAQVARDTAHRGGADVLIITGDGTGAVTRLHHLEQVRAALPSSCLWVGSGVVPSQLPALSRLVDGAIVGTWFHEDGRLDAPLDAGRIRAFMDAASAASAAHTGLG